MHYAIITINKVSIKISCAHTSIDSFIFALLKTREHPRATSAATRMTLMVQIWASTAEGNYRRAF